MLIFNTCSLCYSCDTLCIVACRVTNIRWEVYAISTGHTEGVRDVTLCSKMTSTVKQNNTVHETKAQDDNSTSSSSSISSNSGAVIATCSNDGTIRWWSQVRTLIYYYHKLILVQYLSDSMSSVSTMCIYDVGVQ
jgi:WD40 repeat protein